MTPPEIAGWNLALRFGLELAALAGVAAAAWELTSGAVRWIAVIAAPLVVAVVWRVYNVLDDPSRSGNAPLELSRWTRLAHRTAGSRGGSLALAVSWRPEAAIGSTFLIGLHHATSWSRVRWLVNT